MSILGRSSLILRINSNILFKYSKAFSHNYVCDPAIGLTPEQIEIQKLAKDFARNELYPKMAEFDEKVSSNHCFLYSEAAARLQKKLRIAILLARPEKSSLGLDRFSKM